MSRLASFLVIIAVWAVTYLTNLGSSEFRSEEGHRVMPAVQMLQSGNYMVPHVGTEPYLRKPPLVNWIVAGSFKPFEGAQRMDGGETVLFALSKQ